MARATRRRCLPHAAASLKLQQPPVSEERRRKPRGGQGGVALGGAGEVPPRWPNDVSTQWSAQCGCVRQKHQQQQKMKSKNKKTETAIEHSTIHPNARRRNERGRCRSGAAQGSTA